MNSIIFQRCLLFLSMMVLFASPGYTERCAADMLTKACDKINDQKTCDMCMWSTSGKNVLVTDTWKCIRSGNKNGWSQITNNKSNTPC